MKSLFIYSAQKSFYLLCSKELFEMSMHVRCILHTGEENANILLLLAFGRRESVAVDDTQHLTSWMLK